MSSTAPRLPDSGWKVLYADAFRNWLGTEPPTLLVAPVGQWIESCKIMGPPANGTADPEDPDLHVAPVDGTRVVAQYLVVEFEFLIVVKKFV